MIDVYEVVKKLTGEINPVGETNTDEKRFENLKVTCNLVAKLLNDISEVEYGYKNSQEFSVKRASDYAGKFLKDGCGIKE